MKTASVFETITCSRCRGTGRFSYCDGYRDVCFKCRGSKEVLTVRGQKAYEHFRELCSLEAGNLSVGSEIQVENITVGGRSFSYKGRVESIEKQKIPSVFNGVEYFGICVETSHPKYGKHMQIIPQGSKVRVYKQDDPTRLAEALEYQGSLNKDGAVSKRRGKIK